MRRSGRRGRTSAGEGLERAPAAEDFRRPELNDVEQPRVEGLEGEAEPTKYWFSTLPEKTPLEALVDIAKLRWRIERDYEELVSGVGLAHCEGRGWRGVQRHATRCVAAYGFLIRERAALPPSAARICKEPSLSDRPRPRGGADATRSPRRELDRDRQAQADGRPRQNSATLPMPPSASPKRGWSRALVTQQNYEGTAGSAPPQQQAATISPAIATRASASLGLT